MTINVLTAPSEPSEPTVPAGGSRRHRISVAKVVVTTVCLLLAAMWVYAFTLAPKRAAYRVDDTAWRQRAQQVCEAHGAKRQQLADTADGYISDPTAAQMIERADVVDRATDILAAALAEVTAIAAASERDQSLIAEYRAYYEMILADRRAYTARLRTFQREPYRETVVDGGPVSNLVTDFAVVNQIPACAPPDDLGGR